MVFGLALLCVLALHCGPPPPKPLPVDTVFPTDGPPVDYAQDVQPVLESRCVVCHGCYDAPCQLDLGTYEGLQRGAIGAAVYSPSRLVEAPLTRLFEDAASTEAWREKGFHPVLPVPGARSAESLLPQAIALGLSSAFTPDAKLPPEFPLGISRKLSCPTLEEYPAYARDHPQGGMPYGMASLPQGDLTRLAHWVGQGAPPPGPPEPLAAAPARQVVVWEEFLNGTSLREQLVARYLYEHWFLAHLYFEDLGTSPWLRIVRSATPPGEPVEVLATRRPYDDPGAPFWYRLEPIHRAILHKTHIVYPLSAARMARLRALFLEPAWDIAQLPGRAPRVASNPFLTFDAIPAKSRYEFLLDDARYFVMTFIRGPVCRGQVATNVIRDRFWVAFVDPDWSPTVNDPRVLDEAKAFLSLPAEQESQPDLVELWTKYDESQKAYLELLSRVYDEVDPDGDGPPLEVVWDGDGDDPDALLTVFRHFDNATVRHGFLGGIPETAWLIDYPILERIYYNLVAGFDVFGNLTHQVATRMYMDHLRMQAEDNFLLLIPREQREALRSRWYEGAEDQLEMYRLETTSTRGHGTRVPYETDDPKSELLAMLMARTPEIAGEDPLNRCETPPCDRPGATLLERRAERALGQLSGEQAPWVATLPDVTLVRVRGVRPRASRLYSLVHDATHANVAFIFGESDQRRPERDEVTVVRGGLGSYPNFLFDVPVAEVGSFVEGLRAVQDAAGLEALADRFGVRRTSPRFWETMDWVQEDFRRRAATEAGILDLNRYKNL